MKRSTSETNSNEPHTKVPLRVTFAEQRGEKRSDLEGGHADEDVVIKSRPIEDTMIPAVNQKLRNAHEANDIESVQDLKLARVVACSECDAEVYGPARGTWFGITTMHQVPQPSSSDMLQQSKHRVLEI